MQKLFGLILILITGLLIFAPSFSVTAQQDTDNDGISDSKEQELALKYEPILHFAEGEKFFPIDANYHIENSELFLKENSTLYICPTPALKYKIFSSSSPASSPENSLPTVISS